MPPVSHGADDVSLHETPAEPGDGQMPLVLYLVLKNARYYRLIVDVLMEEEARLGIHLPVAVIDERVRAQLAASGHTGHLPPVETLLADLYANGNVDRIYSTRRKNTVQEYMRKDHYYQLTPQGAQLHREVLRIDRELGTAGALQSAMLPAVLQALDELTALLAREPFDPSRTYAAYRRLTSGFSDLSENAKLFVQGLNRSLETNGTLQIDAFLAYKDVVVRYLNTFTIILERYTPHITAGIEAAEQAGLNERFAELAAVDASPVLGQSPEALTTRHSQDLARQWQGLRSWFHGDAERLPVTEILQERAAEAVSQIMQIVQQINDRRFRRVNRAADLTTLARWFDNAPTEQDTSTLWRAAFGMNPARHLGQTHPLDDDTDHLPRATWWNDTPAPVSARVRHHGPRAAAGAPPRIADTRAAKRHLAARRAQNQQTRNDAENALAARGAMRLSALPDLPEPEAVLLLACLTTGLSARPGKDGIRRARSRDGRLLIVLAPPATPTAAATLTLPHGQLAVADFELTIQPRTGAHT
ncbi:TIGR02677 family protein [Streptomyces sp. NPDC005302]|uniref:TIGR02677 family protein n=1 Tax=Streptomyces sp. NPDC005302 TaxID=3154675 RepID=UPI0033B9FC84